MDKESTVKQVRLFLRKVDLFIEEYIRYLISELNKSMGL